MNEIVTINNKKIRLHYCNTSDSKPLLLLISGGLIQKTQHDSTFLTLPADRSVSPVFAMDLVNTSESVGNGAPNIITLSEYLCKKFHQNKIYLAGHCLGAMLAMHAAADRPDLFYGYIGIAQKMYHKENDHNMYYNVLKHAVNNRDKTVLKRLYQNGPPPYDSNQWRKYHLLWKLVNRYRLHRADYASMQLLFRLIRRLGHTSLLSMPTSTRMLRKNYPKLIQSNSPVTSLEIPVCFLHGRRDPVSIPEFAAQFFQQLQAPGKQFVWFERSGHFPFHEEQEKFWRVVENFIMERN